MGVFLVVVVKVVELIGTSPNSWEDAVAGALKRASKTIRGITGVDVVSFNGVVRGGKIVEYRANVKIAFEVN
ncbi:MAG: dodecin family protein [Candidatus Micrarchaeia archaeon]